MQVCAADRFTGKNLKRQPAQWSAVQVINQQENLFHFHIRILNKFNLLKIDNNKNILAIRSKQIYFIPVLN